MRSGVVALTMVPCKERVARAIRPGVRSVTPRVVEVS